MTEGTMNPVERLVVLSAQLQEADERYRTALRTQTQRHRVEAVASQRAEIMTAAADAFKEIYPHQFAAYLAEGARRERERIKGIYAIADDLVRGHQALIDRMAFDGISSAEDVAMAVMSEERGILDAQGTRVLPRPSRMRGESSAKTR